MIIILIILLYFAVGAVMAGVGQQYCNWGLDDPDRAMICIFWPVIAILGPFILLAKKIGG